MQLLPRSSSTLKAILVFMKSSCDCISFTADFLRGLYSAILAELPKINLTNDEKAVNTAIKYMAQLRHIWQTEVMANDQTQRTGNDGYKDTVDKASITGARGDTGSVQPHAGGGYTGGGHQCQAGAAAFTCSFSCRG